MNRQEMIEKLKQPKEIEDLVQVIIKNPEQIKILTEIIETEKSAVKFKAEKIIRSVSEKKPELVYPYFDFFVSLTTSENSFLKWGAILTVSNLVRVDKKKKFDSIIERYYAPIKGPAMITAVNIIKSSEKIAVARPDLIDQIVKKILLVDSAKYIYQDEVSDECKNIAYYEAIQFFELLFDSIRDQEKVVAFITRQTKNTRSSTRKKAEKFLEKYIV